VPGPAFVALSTTNYLALSPDHADRFREAWGDEVELLDRTSGESRARGLARLVRRAGSYSAVVLDGSIGLRGGYVDLLAAGLIGRRRAAPVVVIGDCTWKRGTSRLDRLACTVGIRAVDSPNLTYCVLSTAELERFPHTWGVQQDRVSVSHWPYVLRGKELEPRPTEDFVFSGGDSLRDYGPLIEAARGLPTEVAIATRRFRAAGADTPANVRAGPVSHKEYVELLRRARIVVVPLAERFERSAGQTTYVNAMALGKLVIATDTIGVRDYIEDARTGLLVSPGDTSAMRRALEWAIDPENREHGDRIAARARETALERFSPDGYVVELLGIARRALERR
jgi:glycosyltransferase involved in cell wall biosynthesis